MRAVTKKGIVDLGGGVRFDAYVLEDGRRVVTQRTLVRALGSSGGDLKVALGRETLGAVEVSGSVGFTTMGGMYANGREIDDIGALASAIVRLAMDGELPPGKRALAQNAHRLLSALAHVALAALVDEATGYQEVRPIGNLAELFARMIRPQLDTWRPRFVDLMIAMYPHYSVKYERGMSPPRELQRPLGLIYDIVLGKEFMSELRRRNPTPGSGSLHHQWLAAEVQGLLEHHLEALVHIWRESGSRRQAFDRMRYRYQGRALQLHLVVEVR